MSRGTKRVMVDPERLQRGVTEGLAGTDTLMRSSRTIAEVLNATARDLATADRIRSTADHLGGVAGHARYVSERAGQAGATYIKPSLPFFPGRKYLRKIRKLANGAGHLVDEALDSEVVTWLKTRPIDPFIMGPAVSLSGLHALTYGDLLDLPGAVQRVRHSMHHPEHPPVWMMALRFVTDEIDYSRQLLRVMRRQFHDWKRRIDEYFNGRPFEREFTGSGRVAFGVSGISSSWKGPGHRRPMGLDVGALGYAAEDQEYFSYDGDGAFSKDDSFQDIERSARYMDHQIRALKAKHPDQPVDIYAHSQGGVVALYWLKKYYNPSDHGYPRIGSVVTIASPLQGTNLANGDVIGDRRPAIEAGIRGLAGTAGVDAPKDHAQSTRDMAVDSRIVNYLKTHRNNKGVPVHSLAADGDLVVPANQAALPGTRPRMISPGAGFEDHSAIVKSPATIQAIKDAQSGRPERFRGLVPEIASANQARNIGHAENAAGVLMSTLPTL